MSGVVCITRFGSHRFQSGQALLLGLGLIGVVALAWSGSYLIGHLVHEKVSLIRATDAAVLSAATIQARYLNLHAYLNRAQLANQLAMMHLVTLASQERFRATQARQSLGMNPPAFLIGMFFGSSYASSYQAAQAGGVSDTLALQNLESAFHQHDQVIHDIIDQTRKQLLHDMISVRNKTLEKILVLNVGESGASLRGKTLTELGLSVAIARDDIQNAIAYLSTQSPVWLNVFNQVVKPYGYLKSRNFTKQNIWAVNVRCPHKRHSLRRRGETKIDAHAGYTVNDTLALHAIRSNRIIGCYEREYPMGWAEVDSAVQGEYPFSNRLKQTDEIEPIGAIQNFSRQPFWRWVKNQTIAGWNIFNGNDNQLAQLWSRTSKVRWQSRSQPGFSDLIDSTTAFNLQISTTQSIISPRSSRNSGGSVARSAAAFSVFDSVKKVS